MGGDTNTSNQRIDDDAFTDLHKAVKEGNVERLESLLENGADIAKRDKNGNTPLLLAMEIEDENTYDTIVNILIKNKANINDKNKVGWTLLYAAVFKQKERCVSSLLKLGASPNERNLLEILTDKPNGNERILKMLLDNDKFKRELINMKDNKGRTPVYKAALHGFKNCLKLLIEYGGDLTETYDEETIIDVIFEEITNPVEFILSVLDCCVQVEKNGDRSRYAVDFSILLPDSTERQMDIISKLLVAASEEEKTELLQHPVIELLLIRKWPTICHFFYLWIAGYVVFVLSMSLYTIFLTENYLGSTLTAIRLILIISSGGLLIHAIVQCVLSHRRRLSKYEMWLNLACTILSLIAAVMGKSGSDDDVNIQNMPNWVLHVTSVAVLLAWTELMLLIGRLPTYGYYALMFSAVLQNVIKVILAFICLLLGFSLSFALQFHGYDEFSDPWRALVKTTVMMMGEFEYADLFAEKKHSLSIPPTSRFIFLMFIILTSIVLMNLMVGLAVSDIQCLQKASHAKKLEKQADFISELEKVFCSRQLKSIYLWTCIRKIFGSHKIEIKYELKTSAKFRRSKNLPIKLIDSLVAIARARREESKITISNRYYSISESV